MVVLGGLFFLAASPLLPTKRWVSTYVVMSGSMEPGIKTGSVMVTGLVEASEVRVGEVITFTSPEDPRQVVVHRVEEKKLVNGQRVFRTKGDNNNGVDAWVVTENLLKGKGWFSIPYLGYLVLKVKTPLGFGLALVIPALILGVQQILKIRQGIHEEVEKKTKLALERHGVAAFVMALMLVIPVTGVYAMFQDQVVMQGISLRVGTFGAPSDDLLFFAYEGKESVAFKLTDVGDVDQVLYRLHYLHDGGEEQIEGSIDNSGHANILLSPKFDLGTCSGEVCTIHTGIGIIYLEITLIRSGGEELLLEQLDLSEAGEVIELPRVCAVMVGIITRKIVGGSGNDRLRGTKEAEYLQGNGGNDRMDGGGGNDCVDGGEGNDKMDGGGENDIMTGGNGNDDMDGGTGNDVLYGDAGNDKMEGSTGNDELIGGEGQDTMTGGTGDDVIWAESNNDTVKGGTGNDMLNGGPGHDVLHGGTGTDVCAEGEVMKQCEG